MNKISIIIPILNEADIIGKLLQHLLDNSLKENIAEIIVVDGGSTDGSMEMVKAFVPSSDSELSKSYREEDPETSSGWTRHNIKFMISPKGRAKQMNLGARNASGNILYFLHADAFPPKDFDNYIIQEIKKNNLAGCFRMKFDYKHWWLKLASWFTQFSWRACRGGDQSQFITKKLFNDIGCFDESFIIYEDNILINELYARNEFVVIQHKIKTSARGYKKKGVWKLQYHFLVIYMKRWFGASAEELHRYYKQHIV